MSKDQFFKFFSFLKNPLWIIIILLIVTNFLLWDISKRIGHDYIYTKSLFNIYKKQVSKTEFIEEVLKEGGFKKFETENGGQCS